MEHTYQYLWIIHFLSLPISTLLGVGILFSAIEIALLAIFSATPPISKKYV